MFRIAICEDEKVILDFETSLVTKWAAGAGCLFELDTYISAEQFLFESEDKAPYDLLIFDIQMKNMNGMELARTLRRRGCNSVIIFITGVADYAIEGYEVGAVRYILKPVKEEIFFKTLSLVYKDCSKQEKEVFLLQAGNDISKIPFEDIVYIEARGHYVHLCGIDNNDNSSTNNSSKNKTFEKEWKCSFSSICEDFEKHKFFCLRRGFMVNLEHVLKINRTDCLLDNGETIPVARGKYQELNEAFIKHYVGQS